MNNWYTLSILLGIIILIWLIDRKKFKREGVFLLRRTKKGLKLINDTGIKYKKFFKIFGEVGIILSFGALGLWYILKEKKHKWVIAKSSAFLVVMLVILSNFLKLPIAIASSAFGAMGFIFSYLTTTSYGIFAGTVKTAGLQIVAPFKIANAPIFYVPLHYFLISILVLFIAHEFSHALVARAQGIKIKNLGYGFLAIIPLAFAEQDEKELKKHRSIEKSRFYSVGSLGNIITGALAVLLMIAASSASANVFQSDGVEYQSTLENMPAYTALPSTGVITKVNENETRDILEFMYVFEELKPDQSISVFVNGEEYTLTTTGNPENKTQAFIGISDVSTKLGIKKAVADMFGLRLPWTLLYLLELLKWLFLLNIGIGLANLLPIKPFDGGLMLEEILKKLSPGSWKPMHKFIGTLTLGLIIINIIGPYLVQYIV